MADPGAARRADRARARRHLRSVQAIPTGRPDASLHDVIDAVSEGLLPAGVPRQRLADAIDDVLGSRAAQFHDRITPGSTTPLDHVVVAPTGVWLIDARRAAGRVERRDVGRFFAGEVRLYLDGRDQSRSLEVLTAQARAIRAVLGDEHRRPPIRMAVCFLDARWGNFPKAFVVDRVLVTWPEHLLEQIAGRSRLYPAEVAAIASSLAAKLRIAS
jgi:hypothetical protein